MNYTLRISSLVKRELKRVKHAHRLARLINDVNVAKKTNCRVSHKVLPKIAYNPGKVSLTLNLLIALDAYFAQRGESLFDKPIFEKPGIIESLVVPRRVVFLLGCRPRPAERRHNLSRWDTRSLAELLTESCKFDVHMEYEIEDVLMRTPMDGQRVGKESWQKLLEKEDRSLIAIGSPLACRASEAMLAAMFDLDAFKTPSLKVSQPSPPFFFAWPPVQARQFRSGFALTWRELALFDRNTAEALRRNQAAAFVCENKVYPVPLSGNRWEMYGVIAAQRRGDRSVWLVVSGLTGPATYAAARYVKRVKAEVPWKQGDITPVLWQPIKATISADDSREDLGDNRNLVKFKALAPPRVWLATKNS